MIKLLFSSQERNFQRLWWAQLISQFGDRMNQFALIMLVSERTSGSAMDLAKIIAFTIIPVFIIQPFVGVFIDRWDRRKTLFICDSVRALIVITIPFMLMNYNSMIPIYIAVFFVFCFSRFYVPAKMSIIPDLVHEDHLLMANSLMTTTGMVALALGGAIGGFLIEYVGSRNGFIIDAATYFVSGAIIFSINIPKEMIEHKQEYIQKGKEFVTKIKKSYWHEMKEGLQYLITHKEIRFIINIIFILLAAAGAVYVVTVVFIQEAFQSITRDLGILAVSLVVGLFGGVLCYGKWGKQAKWYHTIFVSLILGGTVLIILANVVNHYPNIFSAMLISFILGLTIGPVFIAANTAVHLVSDESKRGQVFSALEIVVHFGFLVAMFVSSWLSEFVPKVLILSSVGAIVAFVGLIGFWRSRYHKELEFTD